MTETGGEKEKTEDMEKEYVDGPEKTGDTDKITQEDGAPVGRTSSRR